MTSRNHYPTLTAPDFAKRYALKEDFDGPTEFSLTVRLHEFSVYDFLSSLLATEFFSKYFVRKYVEKKHDPSYYYSTIDFCFGKFSVFFSDFYNEDMKFAFPDNDDGDDVRDLIPPAAAVPGGLGDRELSISYLQHRDPLKGELSAVQQKISEDWPIVRARYLGLIELIEIFLSDRSAIFDIEEGGFKYKSVSSSLKAFKGRQKMMFCGAVDSVFYDSPCILKEYFEPAYPVHLVPDIYEVPGLPEILIRNALGRKDGSDLSGRFRNLGPRDPMELFEGIPGGCHIKDDAFLSSLRRDN